MKWVIGLFGLRRYKKNRKINKNKIEKDKIEKIEKNKKIDIKNTIKLD